MPLADCSATHLRIQATTAPEWSATARKLASQLQEPYRSQLLNDADSAARSLAPQALLFLQAHRQSRIAGIAWAEKLPGRMGQIRAVAVADTETHETGQQLIQTVDQYFQIEQVSFSMTTMRTPEIMQPGWFEACGYKSLCHVDTVCQQLPASTRPLMATSLEFVAGAENHRKELISIIKATYQESLDCPKLQQLRSLDDTLDGYQQQGIVPPSGWSFVQYGGTLVGCLLMTAFPKQPYWELTYLGLVPRVRGQGWGTHLVQHGCSLASGNGAELVIASVDQANEPAEAIYRQLGFVTVDQTKIYAKRIDHSRSEGTAHG